MTDPRTGGPEHPDAREAAPNPFAPPSTYRSVSPVPPSTPAGPGPVPPPPVVGPGPGSTSASPGAPAPGTGATATPGVEPAPAASGDRKSTRLNSSHVKISYAVFCLKKKTHTTN